MTVIFSFHSYPTSEVYESMVDGLLAEYSYLLCLSGLPTKSARVSERFFNGQYCMEINVLSEKLSQYSEISSHIIQKIS